MGFVEGGPYDIVEIVMAQYSRQNAFVQQVDELAVHARFRQREQRVEKHPTRLRQVDDRTAVQSPLHREIHRHGSVASLLDVAESIRLDDVA